MFLVKKDYIYIFPLCIYFAMISGLGIYFIRGKWLRRLLVLLVVGLAVTQYFFRFDSPERESNLLFSRSFSALRSQKIPKLFLGDYFPASKNLINQLRSVIDQTRHTLDRLGEQGRGLIVDLEDYNLQHSGAFLLRINHPKVEVINAFFGTPCSYDEGKSYLLLSDRERYVAEKGSGSCGGCSWRSLELLCRLPDSEITLYRAQR